MPLKHDTNRIGAYFGNYLNFNVLCRRRKSSTKRNNGTKVILIVLILILFTLCDRTNLNLLKSYHSVQYSGDTYYDPCILPDLNPFDPLMMKDRKSMKPINCKGSPPIVYIDSTNILQFNRSILRELKIEQSEIQCECSEILRSNGDNEVKLSEPISCTPPFDFKSDFLKVICSSDKGDSIYSNFLTKIHKKKKYKKSGKQSYNVLVFGLDTVSRSNAFREIPKTVEFLKSNLGAFDFHGYMKTGDNTFPNLVTLLTGRQAFSDELPAINYNEDHFDEFPLIWKNFSAKDYVTLYAEDMPHMNTFNLEKMGFKDVPTDHYMRPYWLAWHSMYSLRKYKSGVALGMLNYDFMKSRVEQYTMCAGDIPNYIAHLRYLKQFIGTYSKEKKFMFSFITELAHNNNNLLHLSDNDLRNFFEELNHNKEFANTILIVFSDHGPKTGDMFLTARLEKSLPMLFVVLPETLQKQYPRIVQNLNANQKRLTTHYDLYTTLSDIAENSYSSPSKHSVKGVVRGYSLFGKIPERSCAEAAVPEHFCVCYKAQPVSTVDKKLIDNMANAVVEKINNFVSVKSSCSKLTLNKVISVNQISEGSLKEKSPHVIRPRQQVDTRDKFSLTVETLPGGGQFYATVIKEGRTISVLEDIDRVNRYKNQSYCVSEHRLRPLCYCKIQ
ncbi:hypothetical protein ACF0H5_000786 [Mactra antiquata]